MNIDNKVWGIRVLEPFKGTTPRNIGIGSTEEDVKKAYPEVKQVKSNGDNKLLEQKSVNKKYAIVFSIEKDKVIAISLTMDLVIQ